MDAIRPQWTVVPKCPACGEALRRSCGAIQERHYVFGAEKVQTPASGIQVYACAGCALVYKSPVPDPAFLAGVFERQMGSKWLAPQDYAAEVALLRQLCGRRDFDLLDVGAAGGDLLAACAAAGVSGRRSALDVARYPGLERSLHGEFIEGFLDNPVLAWSGAPYDVVTVFDVLEHLVHPFVAFSNLRALVKPGGVVLVETGNSASAWPARFGVRRWWYARLIEHHVFWSQLSLQHAAAAHGMEILQWEEVRHKSRRQLSAAEIARDLAKQGMYRLMPDGYARFAALFGKEGNQPCSPFAKDHIRAGLRRI
jgi:2-polyprenyl-3-methyl-5-hydroxy-6-metoxy-1,4-benzoquinol methylase